jgi:uncharacterized protein (DUF302 family)
MRRSKRRRAMLYERETTGSVAEVRQKLEDAAKANKYGVMNVIDLKSKMAEKGVDFGPACLIIEVCNPGKAKIVLEADLRVSTALPCRISVYEEGGKVKVATIRPTKMLDLFGDLKLQGVAREVEETMIRIIDSACG